MTASSSPTGKTFLIFGNQLFDAGYLRRHGCRSVVMVEDEAFCRRYTYHRLKLTFILSAMRSHADALRAAGFDVVYHRLDEGMDWRRALDAAAAQGCRALGHFEVENTQLGTAIARHASTLGMTLEVVQTPMFINGLEDFQRHLDEQGSPKLLPYYRQQRLQHDILMTADREPVGGRWSFDMDNREKLPRDVTPADPDLPAETRHTAEVKALVRDRFNDHPGNLERVWMPTTHAQASDWLDAFLTQRFASFGPYEDALTRRSRFVFHSGLSPLLNVGLLTPQQVLDRALRFGAAQNVPLNSLEGLVRQILGWREFVRGVYHHFCEPLTTRNIWNGDRRLTDDWYRGTTGIAPLDHVIGKTLDLGWAHHIERLMLAANLMNLSGIRPQEVYRWFMEMSVDAYDWVMVPNVFGMGLTSDGGIFTTKPYICGSNYVLKMGDFKRGEWCDVMDGLLWWFVASHEAKLKVNQRLAPMVANLPRVARRRPEIFSLADRFIESKTRAA